MTQWKKLREFFSRPKEKIEITIETKESWEINRFRQSRIESCPVCSAETIFVPADLGAQIAGVEKNVIENLVKGGNLHFHVSGENKKMICLSSLKRTMANLSPHSGAPDQDDADKPK